MSMVNNDIYVGMRKMETLLAFLPANLMKWHQNRCQSTFQTLIFKILTLDWTESSFEMTRSELPLMEKWWDAAGLCSNSLIDLFFFIFFFLNRGISGFAQTNLRPGWQGLLKRPTANEKRGWTPNLVSDESAPNRSARTSWVSLQPFKMDISCLTWYLKVLEHAIF
jgi:hypothetical protein